MDVEGEVGRRESAMVVVLRKGANVYWLNLGVCLYSRLGLKSRRELIPDPVGGGYIHFS